jgi:hypothetical protein
MATQTIPLDPATGEALAVHAGIEPSQIAKYEATGARLLEAAKALTIADQDSYDQACALGTEAKTWEDHWAVWIERPYQVVFGAYKAVLAIKQNVGGRFLEAKRLAGQKIAKWDYDQEQLRLEHQRQMEAEQRKQELEQKLQAAVQAEAAGLAEEAVEQILEEPSTAPKPAAPQTYERTRSVSVRENWAGEVTDFHALVKAAAKNKNLLPLLQINQPALNAQAKTHKANLATAVPGTRGVNRASAAFRQVS